MKISGNTMLITGGGSGIGEALAHRFHDLGNTVVIAGRRQEALEQSIDSRPRMHAMVVDMESADGIDAFASELVTAFPSVNVLINNAGIMRLEALDRRRDLGDAEATITTNLLGPIRLTNALVEHLATRPNSAIVNVTSGLAFVPLAAAPTYSASKAAIHGYTVAMREALKGKIEVIELVPPLVQTELTQGQSTRTAALPLADFVEEVMTLFQQQPTPPEILVERVHFQRHAETEHRLDAALAAINHAGRQPRGGAG